MPQSCLILFLFLIINFNNGYANRYHPYQSCDKQRQAMTLESVAVAQVMTVLP